MILIRSSHSSQKLKASTIILFYVQWEWKRERKNEWKTKGIEEQEIKTDFIIFMH